MNERGINTIFFRDFQNLLVIQLDRALRNLGHFWFDNNDGLLLISRFCNRALEQFVALVDLRRAHVRAAIFVNVAVQIRPCQRAEKKECDKNKIFTNHEKSPSKTFRPMVL